MYLLRKRLKNILTQKEDKQLRPDFLVVGMERSGTHWVAALLNNHPDIACFPSLPWRGDTGGNQVGEVHFFNTIAGLYPEYKDKKHTRPFEDFSFKYNKIFADIVPLKDTVSLRDLSERLLRRYSDYCDAQRGDKKIVGESTPAYVFFLDLIDALCPGVKKIASIRDPKDKIVSWHYNLIRKDKKPQGSSITEKFAIDYLNERIIPEYEALLRYNGEVYIVTYEYLHKNTKKAAADMVSFLGFSVGDAVLSHMVSSADFEQQTRRDGGNTARKKGEEDVKSGLRKGIVSDWKNNMDEQLAGKIDKGVAGLRKKVFDKYHVINI